MQAAVLRALEFDRVRDVLSRLALTALGRARALALDPAVEPDEVEALLALTSDAAAFINRGGALALWAPDDLATLLAVLEVEGQPLEPLALLSLSRFLASVETVVSSVARAGTPRLQRITREAASFEDEAAAVTRSIDTSGEVSDRASTALRDIRDALRRQRAKLRSSLEALTRGRDTAKYLQDQIVTDRNGRYVLVVRAEHQDAISGIVHGSSTSGASVYLEPLATVAINNEVVTLVEREQAEIRRILAALTDAFRLRGEELDATIGVAAEIDLLFAKAELARRTDGLAPEIAANVGIEFVGARHPLLIPSVRELSGTITSRASVVVASDLRIVEPASALVISGPNTGGKTVALKAFGLLALMAQAGLLIPVEAGSRFTPFRTVFADIGDEQSIAASLSTFSAHIANIVATDQAMELPSLVLLDEVGGGTDPIEGGALGAAVVDHFRRRGAVVVVTTHDETMKTYAATTDGVVTAGFGFDPDTYAPSYRLRYGAPGRSLALEIAERLGLPMTVIADARARRSSRESQLAEHLSRIDAHVADLERERTQALAERDALAVGQEQLRLREARLAEREAILKRRADDRLQEKIREARAEVDRVVDALKEKAASLVARAEERSAKSGTTLSTGELGRVRADARAGLAAIAEQAGVGEGTLAGEAIDGPPDIGQTVLVSAFGAEGIVRAISGKYADVEVRGKRMKVPFSGLRRITSVQARTSTRPATGMAPPRRDDSGARSAASELVLVGVRVDEALDRAAKFLDDAVLADERRLRVVHGHGTGRLREALNQFFREHPLVASATSAPEREGGTGATIVELKD